MTVILERVDGTGLATDMVLVHKVFRRELRMWLTLGLRAASWIPLNRMVGHEQHSREMRVLRDRTADWASPCLSNPAGRRKAAKATLS